MSKTQSGTKHTLEEARAEYDRLDKLCNTDTSHIDLRISHRATHRYGYCHYVKRFSAKFIQGFYAPDYISIKKINLSPQIERRGIMPELLSPDSTSVTPELCTMMCLSTVHLRHGTMKSLENCEYDGLPSYRKPVPGDDENSYGAFVCIGDIDKDELFALPRELKTIWEYAHSHGIWWVMFDADAPVCAQFEQFQADWYNNSNMGGANNAL